MTTRGASRQSDGLSQQRTCSSFCADQGEARSFESARRACQETAAAIQAKVEACTNSVEVAVSRHSELGPRWNTCRSTSRNVNDRKGYERISKPGKVLNTKPAIHQATAGKVHPRTWHSIAYEEHTDGRSRRIRTRERSRSSRSKSRSEATGAARSELSRSKRPSARPRGKDIREQRPDAALDVLAAGNSTSTGGGAQDSTL